METSPVRLLHGECSEMKHKHGGEDGTNMEESKGSKQEYSHVWKEKDKDKTLKRVPFYKLFSFADTSDIMLIIFGTLGAMANGLGMPLSALFFGQIIDAFGQNQNAHLVHVISKICLKFVYLAIGIAFAAFLQVTCWMVTGERQAARIRNLYLKAILRQDIAFFDKETNTGEVIGRMSGDTVLIQNAMGEKVGKFIQLMSTFVGAFAIAFAKGWLLTLVMVSTIPVVAIVGAVNNITILKMASRGQAAYAQAATIVEQVIGSIRTVTSFSREKRSIEDYNRAIMKAYTSSVHEGITAGTGLGVLHLVTFSSYALAIWFGSRMILERDYTGGIVINIILSVMAGSMSLGEASPCMSAFAAGQVAAYKMFETINRKPEIDSYDPTGKVLENIKGDLELKDVYFSYPTRSYEQVLRGFSLFISSGTTAALVGQSGSGKSTVINLIERFYDPLSGQILIDGIDLKEFQLRWIRQKIGLVSQEPVLFTSSIKENIAYGKDDATDEEIRNAIMLANASKFIDKLPKGLDTLVGEHGSQLSGGQKQRVAIARAILKNPQILLLDEATSALDTESERTVQEAMDRLMVNRTTVIVAHRLSTVRNAHMIAVIHQGKVVEKGSHSELLRDPHGAYSQLVHIQEMKSESQTMENTSEISKQYTEKGLHEITRDIPMDIKPEHEFANFQALNQHKTDTIHRLVSLNKPETPIILLGLASATARGIILPIFSIILASAVKVFYEPPDELRKDARFWALMFVILGIASLVANPARAYFFALAGSKLVQRIRSMCFERVVHMEVSWFDQPENSSGIIGARLSFDAALVNVLVGDSLGLLVENVVTVISGLLIAFLANWILSLVILGLVPLTALNEYLKMKFVHGFSVDAKKKYEEASQVARDVVGSIRTVVSFCAEDKVMKLYENRCKSPMEAGIKQGLVSGAGFGLSFALLYCVYAADFYAGAQLVSHEKTTFPDVFSVIFALTTIAVGVSLSSSMSPDMGKAKSAAASVFALLDHSSKIDSSNDSGMTLDVVKGEIEFCHVRFRYPSRPDVEIFQDLCLIINAGKTVALVGESGSGKSTIISLLQRFYDPDSGYITLDGIQIQKLRLKWFRQQMGLVSQEPVLFNDTIYANIAYGKEGTVTETEIIAAAELANAHNFISGLDQGYNALVGERGIQLSGGQKQRIAIARAIIKDPRVLLLDEATSALDAESERVVQDALDRVVVNRTTVVVAHRLSTIKNADQIVVVKNGVIVEKGTHDGLVVVKDGVYASLVALHAPAI